MSNLLKTELYKLFHSWYFWGIGIFNLLLSSILLLDSKERSSNLIMASLYNIPLLYFLSIVFIALFIGSDFSGRTLNTYITAGHKRSSIFRVKLIVSQIGCIIETNYPAFTVPRGFKCRNNREINDTHTNLTTSIYCSKPSSITSPVESKRTELRALR